MLRVGAAFGRRSDGETGGPAAGPGACLAGYGLGSIPFGLLLTRWAGAGDIRAIGSGNIGATNVLRTGRKGLALATLLLDLAKGALPAALGYAWLGPPGRGAGGCGRHPRPLLPGLAGLSAAARGWPPPPAWCWA